MANYHISEYEDYLSDFNRVTISDMEVTSDKAIRLLCDIIRANCCGTDAPADMKIKYHGKNFTVYVYGFLGAVHCWEFKRL